MKALRRNDSGAVAVELALILPILVLLLFGMAQFGLAFAQVLGLNSGARQGARLGVVPGSDCSDVIAATKSAATTVGLTASQVDVTVGSSCTGAADPCTKRGDPLVVIAQRDFTVDIPLFGQPTVTLQGKGEYRCETG